MKKLIKFALFVTLSHSLTVDAGIQKVTHLINESNEFTIPNLNPTNCETGLNKINAELSNPHSFQLAEFKNPTATAKIIEELFKTRLNLREKFIELSLTQKVSKTCENSMRESLLNFRFFEEYISKIAGLDADVDVLKGNSPYLLVNKKFGDFKLKSGDIIISRGNAIVSAAIAQIGDQDGHFSHAAMIYIDPQSNITYAIEAHIEIGSDVLPIDDSYTQDGKVRAIVYRYKNALQAQKAAKLAYHQVNNAKEAKNPILYNFAMNMKDENLLFCSQIPFMAFKNTSNRKILLGQQYQTSFVETKNKSFLKGVGVNVERTYSPSDIELDSQLDLVAEWRDLGRTHLTHRKDMVVNRIYQWMEDGLNFNHIKKKGDVMFVRLIRSLPLFNKLLDGSVAPNITPTALSNMMMINYIGDKMLDDLILAYQAHMEKTGYPMTLEEMKAALEIIKIEDSQRLFEMNKWLKYNPLGCSQSGDIICADQPEAPHFMDHFK